MIDYHFYISKNKTAPLIGNFFWEENNGKRYVVLRNSPELKRGSLVIAKEKKEYGEAEYEEHYYISNIEPVHNNHSLKKVRVYLETECEYAERKEQNRRFWIPVIISIIALIKSFDKELVLLWKLIMPFLK